MIKYLLKKEFKLCNIIKIMNLYILFSAYILLLLLVTSFIYFSQGSLLEGFVFLTLPGLIMYDFTNEIPNILLEFK